MLAFSATVTADRITSVLGPDAAIWTRDGAVSAQGDREVAGAAYPRCAGSSAVCLTRSRLCDGQDTLLHVFPVMPVSLAVELGRARSPKAEMPWRIYDQVRCARRVCARA